MWVPLDKNKNNLRFVAQMVLTFYGGSHENFMNSVRSEVSPVSGIATSIKAKLPKMYKVLLHNDDFTPMDFVVGVLEKIFGKDHAEATRVMLDVHHRGYGVCGIFTFDIAETKAALVLQVAQQNEHPLKCTTEEA